MKLIEMTLESFKRSVHEKKQKIIVYGFGVIGKVSIPAYLTANHLDKQLLFYVDAAIEKQGQRIVVGSQQVEVLSPDKMKEVREEFILLISASRYKGILDYLNGRDYLKDVCGCIFPWMLVKASKEMAPIQIQKKSQLPMIPKVIHYCWFGNSTMPDKIKMYMESWKKFCPEYEIKEWNESNYDVSKHSYCRQAYEHGKWAFVSDLARLDILYENGGIYLDTDVELIKSLDDLLYQPAFCGVEKWRHINTGGGCGAVPNHPAIKKMREYRAKNLFIYPSGKLNMESSGFYESDPLIEDGFVPDNTVQVVDDMTIYPSDFFHPYDYMWGETSITENTYGIHHFQESWV